MKILMENIIHIPYVLFGNYITKYKLESINNKYLESNDTFRLIENNETITTDQSI